MSNPTNTTGTGSTGATPAVCYGRVSTDTQADDGHSLDAQRRRTEAYCAAMDLEPTTWLHDAGVSGTIAPADRLGLSAALDRLAAGCARALVVTDLDRLSRRTRDILALADTADAQGWRLVVISMSLDTGTPAGRFALTVLAAVAQLERDMTSARTTAALDELRAQGRRLGRPASDATRAAGQVAVRLRAQGWTWQAIADRLSAEDYRTARGCGTWSPTQARRAHDTIVLDRQAEERRAAAN